MTSIIWVLVNCPSAEDAVAIGDAVLRARQVSCYDIFPRLFARYFWPPGAGTTEETQGVLLVLETLPYRYGAVARLVREHHPDDLPFIGALRVEGVTGSYQRWMRGELTSSTRLKINRLKRSKTGRILPVPWPLPVAPRASQSGSSAARQSVLGVGRAARKRPRSRGTLRKSARRPS